MPGSSQPPERLIPFSTRSRHKIVKILNISYFRSHEIGCANLPAPAPLASPDLIVVSVCSSRSHPTFTNKEFALNERIAWQYCRWRLHFAFRAGDIPATAGPVKIEFGPADPSAPIGNYIRSSTSALHAFYSVGNGGERGSTTIPAELFGLYAFSCSFQTRRSTRTPRAGAFFPIKRSTSANGKEITFYGGASALVNPSGREFWRHVGHLLQRTGSEKNPKLVPFREGVRRNPQSEKRARVWDQLLTALPSEFHVIRVSAESPRSATCASSATVSRCFSMVLRRGSSALVNPSGREFPRTCRPPGLQRTGS